MPGKVTYRSACSHNGLSAGALVEMSPEQEEEWAGEIEAGFLVRDVAVISFDSDTDSAGEPWDIGDPDAAPE